MELQDTEYKILMEMECSEMIKSQRKETTEATNNYQEKFLPLATSVFISYLQICLCIDTEVTTC